MNIHSIYCIENIFIVQDYWATCACFLKQSFPAKFLLCWIYFLPFKIVEQLALALKKQSCPEIFHCIEYVFSNSGVLSNLRLPWETEDALNSLYWKCIFYHSGFLSNLRLPWKTELPWKFSLYRNIFHHSGFLSNSQLPWKTELPWNFSLYSIMCTFIMQKFRETCAYPEKQRVPWIHCTEYVFFIIQDFSATCACPEKQSCPGIFHCIEYTFNIQEFWATCACPEKQSCPGFTALNMYFLFLRIFQQLALALINRVALEFFKPGRAAALRPTPRLVRLCWEVPNTLTAQKL